jgi:hypothetical protein
VAVDTLERLFLGAVALGGSTGQQQGIARTGPVARNEWRGLLAGAVAQPTRPTWTMCASASPSGSPRANVMKDCPAPGLPIVSTRLLIAWLDGDQLALDAVLGEDSPTPSARPACCSA